MFILDVNTENNILNLTKALIKDNPYFIKNHLLINGSLKKSLEKQVLFLLTENSSHVYTYIFNNFKEPVTVYNFIEKIDDLLIEDIKSNLKYFYHLINLRYKFYCKYINELIENLLYFQKEKKFKKIDSIELNQGDSHNEGKFAVRLKLDKQEYIYKPRNSNVELKLNKFINKFIDGYGYKIYNYDNFSICEKLSYISPDNNNDIEDYFYNQGMISAILFFLSSSDNHYENVIINKKYPYYIDLECFNLSKNNKKNIFQNFDYSIFLTSIFPFTMDDNYTNISALTGSQSEVINPNYTYTNYVLDNNKYRKIDWYPYTDDQENIVFLNKNAVEANNYRSSIKQGFAYICDLILQKKLNYVDFTNILKEPTTKCRYVYKNTDLYYRALKLMEEPYYLQSKEHAKLAINSIISDKDNDIIKEYEEKTLLSGDIPIYYIEGKSLITGDGQIIKEFFAHSLYNKIKNNIINFSSNEKKRCLNYIEKSLLLDHYNLNKKDELFTFKKISIDKEFQCFISELKNTDILYLSFSNDVAKFTCINGFMYELGGTILANGLYAKEKHIELDLKTIYQSIKKQNFKYMSTIDATYGISSYIYFTYMLYKITDNKFFLQDLESSLTILLEYNYEKISIDLFSGISGSLLILNKLYKDLPNNSNYKQMVLKVIKKQMKTLETYNFSSLTAGYAHGLSGIIYTLNLLYTNFGSQKVFEKIHELIQIEDSYFNEKKWNYIDTRTHESSNYFLCYGLPGILQVRMRLHDKFKNKQFIQDCLLHLGDAIINNKLVLNSICICHGIGSIIDLFVDGLNYEMVDKKFFNKVVNTLKFYAETEKFSITDKHEGFATGLFGFYYSLLRVDNPQLPSLLLFDIV